MPIHERRPRGGKNPALDVAPQSLVSQTAANPAIAGSGIGGAPARAASVMSHWADDGPSTAPAKVVSSSENAKSAALPPLGEMGPLGAYGPLGTLGPVGRNAWNPSTLISGSVDWSKTSQALTASGGPLSEQGPLGPNGPVGNVDQYGSSVMPELRPGGDAAVLGALGPLGTLGPLGPLGPVGAHGYKADAEGNYRDANGQVVRSVDVPYEGSKRAYPLVENYTEDKAKKMKDNDTSFMVSGSIDRAGESDDYSFTASDSEFVTINLVPEKQLDAFDMVIRSDDGSVLFESKSQQSMDWAQLRVKAGTHLRASVRLKQHNHFLTPTYRLIVTGSTQSAG